jgi:hypothetical protein
VFEPLTGARASDENTTLYLAAFELMKNADPGALAAFEDLCRRYPDDALAEYHLDRLREGDSELLFVFLDGSQELLQARLDARKGHFMPPGLLGSQLATLERPNLATEKCLHVSISLSPEQICATVGVAMRRFA